MITYGRLPFLRSAAVALAALLSALCAERAEALYVRPELDNVPVDQLIANLTKQAKAKPKDAAVRLNLARAHAMAFANKSDTLPINKQQPEAGVWVGYEPQHVPFTNQPTDDEKKMAAAKAQLVLAIADYKQAIALAPDNLTARLGYAWCLDQSGDTMRAIEEYRKTIELGWEQEKDLDSAPLGWHSVVGEASGYLIALLDAKVDVIEISRLQERTQKLSDIPRPVTPIAVPLRNGLTATDLEDRAADVSFDADGTGLRKRWTWITGDAAWLVYDRQDNGQITSAIQMFGSVTFWLFWDNGYQALAALDNNGDGALRDDELTGLALWHDRNGNGVSETGEVQPLAAYGIVSLSCRGQIDASHADGIQYAPRGVTFADGATRATYDLVLHPSAGRSQP